MNDLRVQAIGQSAQATSRLVTLVKVKRFADDSDDKTMKTSRLIWRDSFLAAVLLLGSFSFLSTTSAVQAESAAPVPVKAAAVATSVTNVIAATAAKELEAKWGIQITALRISAAGNVIDFRYRVTDSDKASALGNSKLKPALIDKATGKSLFVPNTKAGQMRSTGQRLAAGKTYTALFTNPGKLVKSGSKVTIVIGDFRAEDLTVGE
jgi:hypothetical protein